jgi:hypothetical protein
MKGYLNVINQRVAFHTRFQKGDGRYAFQTNTALIAKLLALERANCYTVKDHWGAGFEVAYYDGNKFNKISEIAYLICEGNFSDQGDIGFPVPRLVMFYRYVNEILYITSVEIIKCTGVEVGDFVSITSLQGDYASTVFEVPGIDLEDLDAVPMPQDFSFETNQVAIGYLLAYKGSILLNPSAFNLGPEINIRFRQDGELKILMHLGLNEDLRAASRDVFESLVKG